MKTGLPRRRLPATRGPSRECWHQEHYPKRGPIPFANRNEHLTEIDDTNSVVPLTFEVKQGPRANIVIVVGTGIN